MESSKALFDCREDEARRHPNRKKHNQYFTPEFAVEKALACLSHAAIKSVIDPAVGEGAFLRAASKVWRNAKLFGIDIDNSIIKRLKNLNLKNAQFYCADTLSKSPFEIPGIRAMPSGKGFDLVAGNPPFSSWFNRVDSVDILANFRLAYKNGKMTKSRAIEVLFIERFIDLAREGGFIVIVLPDSILSNPQYQYVREFILQETKIVRIISLPRNVFENTSAKTSILILQKRGMKILNYLVPVTHLDGNGQANGRIKVEAKNLLNRMDYYYHHYLENSALKAFTKKGLDFRPLRDFVIYCKTGKTRYGQDRKFSRSGLRFLHATNITEIGIDYKKDEKFIEPSGKMYFADALAKVGDIVFVRVGVGCAGRVAIVDTKEEEGQATDYLHIFRVKDIDPYFLVVYLKTKFGYDSINLLKHGVGTVSINKNGLLSLLIPVLPNDIQLKIGQKYKGILHNWRRYGNTEAVRRELYSLISDFESNLENYDEKTGFAKTDVRDLDRHPARGDRGRVAGISFRPEMF